MIESLLRRLTATGWRRGRSGSRGWLVVASVAGGLRLLRYIARDREEVLYRTRVAAGDRFEIKSSAPPTR